MRCHPTRLNKYSILHTYFIRLVTFQRERGWRAGVLRHLLSLKDIFYKQKYQSCQRIFYYNYFEYTFYLLLNFTKLKEESPLFKGRIQRGPASVLLKYSSYYRALNRENVDEGIKLLNTSNIYYKCRCDGRSGCIWLFYNLPKLILLDPLSPQMMRLACKVDFGIITVGLTRPFCVAAHLERLRILWALCLFSHWYSHTLQMKWGDPRLHIQAEWCFRRLHPHSCLNGSFCRVSHRLSAALVWKWMVTIWM